MLGFSARGQPRRVLCVSIHNPGGIALLLLTTTLQLCFMWCIGHLNYLEQEANQWASGALRSASSICTEACDSRYQQSFPPNVCGNISEEDNGVWQLNMIIPDPRTTVSVECICQTRLKQGHHRKHLFIATVTIIRFHALCCNISDSYPNLRQPQRELISIQLCSFAMKCCLSGNKRDSWIIRQSLLFRIASTHYRNRVEYAVYPHLCPVASPP